MQKKKTSSFHGTGEDAKPAAWIVGKYLPTGTVTFLFTDIEGSTPHWESQPDLMEAALKIHNDILHEAIQGNGGGVFKIVGDEFQAAFPTAPQALQAAVAIQLDLQNAEWNALGPLKVRMGLHTGEAHPDDIGDEYAVSHTKNRVGRIRSAAHGGQILLSQESADLCATALPAGIHLEYLGEFRLKGLARREPIFQVCGPGLQKKFPPLTTISDPKHNLPRQLTSFIGRENEIEQIKFLLTSHSMVTLTGSGGVGKTRLSIRVAEDLLGVFPDGVWVVELAPLTDPKLVVQTVALTMGLREDVGRSYQEALEYFLKSRQILLALDNCEHLIETCAHLADRLLRQCPQVKLLATSREALGVAGEMVYHVPSLSMSDPQEPLDPVKLADCDAVRLLLDRGRDVLPTFQITPQNAPHILSICQRLDGIPLALELAAARLNMLSTEQLSARLDNTFRLLVGGARTAVPRQQTLRATIDWSYQLINPSEQLLLRRLSVFVGSFYLEGVEATCTDQALEAVEILDILTSLVNKSMLIADRIQGVKPSYHLLETVRQYAREKLFDAGESEALRNRHLAYYVDFAEQAAHHIHDAGRLEWTAYLKTEHANIREALEWAFTDQTLTLLGLRIATAITDRFWFTLGYYREGEYWLARGLQIAGDKVPPPLLASVYYSLGRLFALHDKTNTLHFLNLCIDLSRELAPVSNRELAMALALSASAYDPETALQRSTEGVKIARTLASTDVWPLAEALYFQSDVLFLVGLSDQAFAAAQECVQLAEMGDRWMAGGYWLSGVIQTQKDQFELARQNLKKGLERNIEVDDRMGIWYSLLYLSWHYLRSGKLHQVQVYCRDLLKLNDLFKTLYHFYDLGLAGLLLARYQKDVSHTQVPEEWLDAVHLLAAFEKWGESFFTLGYELIKKDHLDALSFLRQNIDPVVFEAAWEEGRQLAEPLDEAINYALSLVEKYTFQDCPA